MTMITIERKLHSIGKFFTIVTGLPLALLLGGAIASARTYTTDTTDLTVFAAVWAGTSLFFFLQGRKSLQHGAFNFPPFVTGTTRSLPSLPQPVKQRKNHYHSFQDKPSTINDWLKRKHRATATAMTTAAGFAAMQESARMAMSDAERSCAEAMAASMNAGAEAMAAAHNAGAEAMAAAHNALDTGVTHSAADFGGGCDASSFGGGCGFGGCGF